ncbi:hypothetical protein GCM10023094_24780 [Rhodococcus olei]|uniref:Uncharacterized protein n=1 Tax=Rhodococcus olei TaxID=2161675 RepID=A0ABP8P3W8_9NOCA
MVADAIKRRNLALEYAPLLPVFNSALDRHGSALALPSTGEAAMRADLGVVAEVLAAAGP